MRDYENEMSHAYNKAQAEQQQSDNTEAEHDNSQPKTLLQLYPDMDNKKRQTLGNNLHNAYIKPLEGGKIKETVGDFTFKVNVYESKDFDKIDKIKNKRTRKRLAPTKVTWEQ